ncbi:uracil-DNA glycosylase [Candidatus Fermentibacteria bacterium]|nr:uracil-DNA glycosylase [Candidatus Fermentibacteria bacterium]
MREVSPHSPRANSRRQALGYFRQLRDLGEGEIYCATPFSIALMVNGPTVSPSLQSVEQAVAACRACALHQTRRTAVPGAGNPNASLVMVGEAPGNQEDREGKPFVGPSGQLLRRLLNLAGIADDRYYLLNVLKCRPPGNRDPAPEEIDACRPFLDAQLVAVAPRLIVCLGRFAGREVLRRGDLLLRDMRGVVHRRGDAAVIVTYHPSALLHTDDYRVEAWRDIKRIWHLARDLGLLTGSAGR